MDEDDQRKRRIEEDRALKAKAITDSPLWHEAYEKVMEHQLSRMLASGTTDEETLQCKRRILALNDVKQQFSTVIQTGILAREQLEAAKNE